LEKALEVYPGKVVLEKAFAAGAAK
jgi:hypothetical protein